MFPPHLAAAPRWFLPAVSGPLVLSVQQASWALCGAKGEALGSSRPMSRMTVFFEKHVTSQLQSILWLPSLQLLRVAFVASRS